jgi:hypothetical protein
MAWKELGNIFWPSLSNQRATTHMQGPVAILKQHCIRIFFAARDLDGKSYPAFIDVDRDDPNKVLSVHEDRIFGRGPTGTFDDDGAMPACAISLSDSSTWLYYSGWNRRLTVPYHNTIGISVARSPEADLFERMFDGPILERSPYDPFMVVTPWVMRDRGQWRMWYVAGLNWLKVDGALEPVYGIKHAVSDDGISWVRDGRLVIPRKEDQEAIARPTVLLRDGVYHMWYSYRRSTDFRDGSGSYRIGYSRSEDGEHWLRYDEYAGLPESKDEWCSTMQCYPYLLEVEDRLLMFYNGNGFGQTGIGCAWWEGALPAP